MHRDVPLAAKLQVMPRLHHGGNDYETISVNKAQAAYRAALLDGDVAALARIWTEDYTFINGRGMFLSKDDRLNNVETGATQLESIRETGRQVRLYGRGSRQG